ncbi:MAG: hypothetical protein JKY26_11470 [Pseudomonas sp.]|nr:hypothetical protein [Pseudomonas sp.]
MKPYQAFLERVKFQAGPNATLKVVVNAPNALIARTTAEAQFPGYRCFNTPIPVR